MFRFVIGFALGAVALAYYPVYIDDVKAVTNNAARAVVDATNKSSVIDQAREFAQ